MLETHENSVTIHLIPSQPLWTAIKGEYLIFLLFPITVGFIHCCQYSLIYNSSQHCFNKIIFLNFFCS